MALDNRYLERRRQTWFAVVEVPPSLQKRLGRRIRRTLKTRDVHVARARRHKVVGEIKELIEAARNGKDDSPIQQEAMAWRETLAAAERGDNVGSIPEDEDPAGFIRSLIEDRSDSLRAHKDTEADAAGFQGVALGTATPLALYVAQWLSEGALKGTPLKERTKHERRKAAEKLGEWMQTVKLPSTVEAVTRKVAGRYVSEVLIPSGKDAVTLGKSVRSLASYWAWLQKRGHLPDEARNPWAGQAPKKTARDGDGIDAERAFTDAELARLLTGPAGDTLADFMRVAALTGMRREEIGQLKAADCAGGVFIIRAGKTDAAARRVPVHPDLAGIVAKRLKGKAPDAYLFHDLASASTERTDPIGKAFTRYRRELGIQEGEGRRSRVNFHSFRRWFITAAINAKQPDHFVSLVVGHKEGRKGMTKGRYWQGLDDAALRAVVEAVKLPAMPAQQAA